MRKLVDKLSLCIETIGGVAVLLMTVIVLLQIVMRYVFNTPLTWTEEIARYIFVYITFLGAGLLVYERSHLFVEVIFNSLSGRVKRSVQLCIDSIVLVFSVYLVVSSKSSMLFAFGSRSTATQIPMQYISMSVMIGAILMTIFALYNVVKDILQISRKRGGE